MLGELRLKQLRSYSHCGEEVAFLYGNKYGEVGVCTIDAVSIESVCMQLDLRSCDAIWVDEINVT